MFKKLFLPFILVVLGFAPAVLKAQGDPPMTNEEVIALSKAGLAPSVIIGKIRTSKTQFDLSTD
ncbi:hypothetical protein OFM21_31670, partial [Escherichia coli]|nr:hypothetical protein [Escherichia coli]